MPPTAPTTVDQLAHELVVDAGDVHVVLRQHDVHADELLAHNVADVRGVLDPDGERTSHFAAMPDGQLVVGLEEEHVAVLRTAAQHVGELTGVPPELGSSIARTLYSVVIELNNGRPLPIEVRRAAVSLAEQVLRATQPARPTPPRRVPDGATVYRDRRTRGRITDRGRT